MQNKTACLQKRMQNKTGHLQKSGKRVWQFTVQPYQIAHAGMEDGYFDPVETVERRYCHQFLLLDIVGIKV